MTIFLPGDLLGCQTMIAAALYTLEALDTDGDSGVSVTQLEALLYLSDKASGQDFGQSLTEQRWHAGFHTPQQTLLARLLTPFSANRASNPFFALETNGKTALVSARLRHDEDQLSQANLECLDAVISRFGIEPELVLTVARDAAWQAGRTRIGREMLLEEIIGTLENPGLILEHLRGE